MFDGQHQIAVKLCNCHNGIAKLPVWLLRMIRLHAKHAQVCNTFLLPGTRIAYAPLRPMGIA